MLNANELELAMCQCGCSVTLEEIKKIIQNVNYSGNGKINYSEFIAATVNINDVLNYNKLYALFKYFDIDDTGIITP